MNKDIFVLFTDELKAQSVAMALAQNEGIKDIKIESKKGKSIYLTNYTFSGSLAGAVIGILLFNIASFFLANGNVSANLTLEGALTGAVIGAISGAFSDIFLNEVYDNLSTVRMHASPDKIRSAVKQLKKRGAIQLYLERK